MSRPASRIVRRPLPATDAADWPAHWPEPLRRVHALRGSANADAANPKLASLLDYRALLGIDAAVALLRDAIRSDARILISADFDCDGATACAVAVRGLRMLGANNVIYAVPDRQRHGYGLTPGFVAELLPLQPDLLVTVDHGIACHAGINAARAQGWRVLVTDHHLPAQTLPDADAIVDPRQPGDGFASKSMAGVGVMFYVLLALRAAMRADGEAIAQQADLSALLDLVAVGTVADMVPLDANNRALVAAGLRRIRAGQTCAGLLALIDAAGRDATRLTASDIGYAIAPRINAAGRLEDMRIGIECLLADDAAQAGELARALSEINSTRQDVQQTMLDAAHASMQSHYGDAESLPPALCLFDPEWHAGVVGLVASKLKDATHRPVLAFAPSGADDDMLRGSMRSIAGFHARDALALIDAQHPGLIARFGGHAMAAGLSLPIHSYPGFVAAFEQIAREQIDPGMLQSRIDSDGALPPEAFDIATASALRDGGIWGQAYPEPVFDGEFTVAGWRAIGGRHLKLQLLHDDGTVIDAIQFGGWDGNDPSPRIHIAYRLVPDDWKGGDAVQLVVVHRSACD